MVSFGKGENTRQIRHKKLAGHRTAPLSCSKSYGFSFVAKYGISIDYIEFDHPSDENVSYWGCSITISVGAGAEVHAGHNITRSTSSWNPFKATAELFY